VFQRLTSSLVPGMSLKRKEEEGKRIGDGEACGLGRGCFFQGVLFGNDFLSFRSFEVILEEKRGWRGRRILVSKKGGSGFPLISFQRLFAGRLILRLNRTSPKGGLDAGGEEGEIVPGAEREGVC
jgi:hypothetical protein